MQHSGRNHGEAGDAWEGESGPAGILLLLTTPDPMTRGPPQGRQNHKKYPLMGEPPASRSLIILPPSPNPTTPPGGTRIASQPWMAARVFSPADPSCPANVTDN